MNSIIIIDKSTDWTSHDVVAKLRGALKIKRIGHGGTLDPMATGVLPIFIGQATKLSSMSTDADKEYIATLRLGIVTDTQDITGTILSESNVTATVNDLFNVLPQFIGKIQQVPPMYSAIKKKGKKLYELARKGIEVEREPREVIIHDINLLSNTENEFKLHIICSKGTYIRTLCHDIGQALGTGGTLSSLRRTRSGDYRIEDSHTLDEVLEAIKNEGAEKLFLKKRVIALGYFDGVHLGHAELLKQVVKIANEKNLTPSVLTFDTHPQSTIEDSNISLINSIEDRKGLIRRLFGINDIVTLCFDKETASTNWDDFINLLVRDYGACYFIVGYDFRFGKNRDGTSALLKQKCLDSGLGCDIIPEVLYDGTVCNSSYIRELLIDNKLERANEFLGHPHVLTDIVRSGKQLGRTLDIPTINMQFAPGILIPTHGVYAVKVFIGEEKYGKPGISNIGVNPTVGDSNIVTVETHIIDFHNDIYSQKVRLEFHKYLRPEQKFNNLQELKAQIQKDCAEVAEWFKE
ncbi:MAG: tRNA pseudouridine(55) synthase TruB [Oscillospiraceae bacterium]|jgi:tRNA pseudouridine(55) synthase/riboflavin kinase/FMN adenylyltransferase|nr:tRNA pseudouridine(55) synthase TruB [Oscillospiraceae bacterium]